jgi:hypothetical protein
MKTTICIATRGRAAAAIGVVMAAHRLKSGDQHVDFVMGMDDDDPDADLVRRVLEPVAPVKFSIEAPTETRGYVENRMLKMAYDGGADIVTLMTDRTFIISPQYDMVLVRAMGAVKNRVLWWSSPEDPGCVIPIIPRSYLEAIDCNWDMGVHPFWWSDTFQQEIDLMLYGMPSLKVNACYSGTRGITTNGRDFTFWLEVFRAMRPVRRKVAHKLAMHFGIVRPDQGQIEDYFVQYDRSFAERCPQFEASFGDQRPPSDRYLLAKKRATEWLEAPHE